MIIINCKNKILGRISSIISKILLNFFFLKKKIFILLFNIEYIIYKKKLKYKHSGYIGNLKIVKHNKINIFKKSIYNMISKNKKKIEIMKYIYYFNYKL